MKADIAKLPPFLRGGLLREEIIELFDVRLTEEQVRQLQPRASTPAVVKAAPTLVIPSAPRPWGLYA